ncbi:MAG: FAD-dependent oxidoreductase [Gammaproteobacteria bacterium]|nr:FAD-dependent oxidoreductase [Gammaproteobacteria bacterium]
MTKPLVIVGSGLAGYTVAREFRKLNSDQPLLMITADGGESYSKPMLSNAFSAGKDKCALSMASAVQMAEKLNATVLTETSVRAIDPQQRQLRLDGQEVVYDKLVLALGASPLKLKCAGDAVGEVLQVNNLDDYQRFFSRLQSAQSVLVIGSGLVGCEFANDLALSGKQVTLLGRAATPLNRLLPAEMAAHLQQKLAQVGVVWQSSNQVVSINRAAQGYAVRLADGTSLQVGLILSALGLRANVALAEQAGLQTERAICVDRMLCSSQDSVYALGDCVQVEGLHLPFVLPLMKSAHALAKTLAGVPTEVVYPAMPVTVKTKSMPLVISPPQVEECEVELESRQNGQRALYWDQNRTLQGFVLSGDCVAEKQQWTRVLPAWLAEE